MWFGGIFNPSIWHMPKISRFSNNFDVSFLQSQQFATSFYGFSIWYFKMEFRFTEYKIYDHWNGFPGFIEKMAIFT